MQICETRCLIVISAKRQPARGVRVSLAGTESYVKTIGTHAAHWHGVCMTIFAAFGPFGYLSPRQARREREGR